MTELIPRLRSDRTISTINISTEHVYMFNETTVDDPEGISEQRQRLVYRDKDIPNRFWFQFPSELRTSERSENIIGIRSCILTNGDRHCKFTLDILKTELSTGNINEIRVGIGCHISKFDSFEKLIEDVRWFVRRIRIANEEEWKEAEIPIIDEYNIGYSFERENDSGPMCFVIEGRDQYNTYGSSSNLEIEYETKIKISDLDEEGRKLLLINELPTEYSKKIYFPLVWDRNPVIIKSSLAINSIGNYIGYTNSVFNPIKFYKLSSNDSRFWIEMYNGTDHISPAIIPMDGKDSFLLEIVVNTY